MTMPNDYSGVMAGLGFGTSKDKNAIEDINTYKRRIYEYLYKLLSGNVITYEDYTQARMEIASRVASFTIGATKLNDMPLYETLTSPTYDIDLTTKLYLQKMNDEAISNKSTEKNQKLQEINRYNPYGDTATSWDTVKQREQNLMMADYTSATQNSSAEKNAQTLQDLKTQDQALRINAQNAMVAKEQADKEQAHQDFLAGLSFNPASKVMDAANPNLSPNQRQYFTSSAMYNKYMETDAGARQLWLETVNSPVTRPANSTNYMDTAELTRNSNAAKVIEEKLGVSNNAAVNMAAAWAQDQSNPDFMGMSTEAKSLVSALGTEYIDWQNNVQGEYAAGVAARKAKDPLQTYMEKYPYMSEWLKLSPNQRGARMATTGSKWVL
jgi:hypothetical protein